MYIKQKGFKFFFGKKNFGGRELEKIENEHKTHLNNARSLRQQMKRDMLKATQDDTVETLTFDLERLIVYPGSQQISYIIKDN